MVQGALKQHPLFQTFAEISNNSVRYNPLNTLLMLQAPLRHRHKILKKTSNSTGDDDQTKPHEKKFN